MPDMRRFLDLTGLGIYDAKIKNVIATGDAQALADAKKYFDDNKGLFEAAGTVKTAQEALQAAIDAVNARVNGILDGESIDSFKDVETELAKYQPIGDYATKTEAQGYANAKDEAIAAAKKSGDDAQSDLNTFKDTVSSTYETKSDATSKLTEAKGYTDTEVAKVDAKVTENTTDIEELAGKVAVLETSGYDDTEVRGLIKSNADAIDLVEADVEVIKGDYLKSTDKTELATAINTEKERAEGIESGLRTDVDAIKADYLKAADKDALQTQINTILNNPDAEGAINSINEFTQYITEHGEIAEGFRTDIDQNKEDIESVEGALNDYKTLVGETYATKTELANEKKSLQDEIDADVAVVAGRVTTLEGVVANKADTTYVDEQVETLQGVDTGLANRISALEAKHGDGEGTVESLIATAKAEAIEEAKTDASNKDAVVLSESQKYTDAEIDKVELTIDTLEGVVNGKADSSVVSGIDTRLQTAEGEIDTLQSEMDAVEAAVATKANSSDVTTLAGRVTVNEGDISTLKSEMDSVESRLDDAESAIEDKAESSVVDALTTRVGTAETNISANTAAIAKFTEITEAEINALFA